MLQFVCHPALQNLLTTSKEGMNCVTSTNNAVLISDYLPTTSPSIHAGLPEAVKFRLFNPSHIIFFASFFPKEMLLPFDTFGILSLAGTEFIRLPLQADQLLRSIKEKQTNGINLSKSDWETFALKAGNALLKEILSVYIHGGHFKFVSRINLNLRCWVFNCKKNRSYIHYLKEALSNLRNIFNDYNEFVQLKEITSACENLSDDYIQLVSSFVKGLTKIFELADANENDIDLNKLDKYIDELISNANQINI